MKKAFPAKGQEVKIDLDQLSTFLEEVSNQFFMIKKELERDDHDPISVSTAASMGESYVMDFLQKI